MDRPTDTEFIDGCIAAQERIIAEAEAEIRRLIRNKAEVYSRDLKNKLKEYVYGKN